MQEEETGECEAANKSLEVHIATVNENSVNSEKQPISLPEKEDYHDRHKDLISVDLSEIGDTPTNNKLCDNLDVTEEQASDESFKNSLISNDVHDKVNESATDKESTKTNGKEVGALVVVALIYC